MKTISPHAHDDVLEGAQAIADFMGFKTRRPVYSAVESNVLPVFRMGKNKICARPSVLQAFMAKQEREAA